MMMIIIIIKGEIISLSGVTWVTFVMVVGLLGCSAAGTAFCGSDL
jgi:hypothetical protein